jgi:hypothetical protein
MKNYTTDELLDRWEDLREIKNIMGRVSADYMVKKEGSLYENYWSKRPDVSLGLDEGWYDGAEAVKGYFDSLHAQVAHQSKIIAGLYPEGLEGKSEEELHGIGTVDYKPVDTPVIEIAGDRLTAKGIWCLRGSHSKITTSGPVGYWEWGYFAVDFVNEDEVWRIWHMQYLHDILLPNSSRWYGEPVSYAEEPGFEAAEDVKVALPNKPATLRVHYSINRKFAPSPKIPEPYGTFAETFSYGYKEEA